MAKPRRRKMLNWGSSKRKKGKKAATPVTQKSANTAKDSTRILPPILDSETNSQEADSLRKRKRQPSETFQHEAAISENAATVNPISQESKQPLKIKKTEFLNLLSKLKPTGDLAENRASLRPNSMGEIPVSSCSHGRRSRMSRPVYFGDLSSSENEEDPKKLVSESSSPPHLKSATVNAIAESLVSKEVEEESMGESESETGQVKLSTSTSIPSRKRKPKRRLAMRKRIRGRVSKSPPPEPTQLLISAKALPTTSSPSSFAVVDIKELRICLTRVGDLPEFRELLSQFYRNVSKSLQKTELFGSDSDDEVRGSDLSSEDEYSPPASKFHSCHICDSSFGDESTLEEHIETKHGAVSQNQKPVKCSYCSRFFTNRKMLDAHESLHAIKTKVTVTEKSDYKGKLYSCPFCSKKFTKNTGLAAHIDNQHTIQQQQHSKDGLDKTYKLRKRISLAKKHIRPRREPINDLPAAIADGSFVPPEPIYVNNGIIALGPVKRELKAENIMAIIGEPEEDNYFQVTTESMKDDMGLLPVIVKFGHGEIEPLAENETEDAPTIDPLMIPDESHRIVYQEEEERDISSVIPFDMTNGVQCNLSDMGSLLDILDGPDPNLGVSGYTCETLTLNYEKNDDDKETGSFKCEYCPKILGSKSLLQLHRKESHAARVRKPYICLYPNCSQRFESSQSLQIHRNKAHSRKEDVAEVPIVTAKEPEPPATPLPLPADFTQVSSTNQDVVPETIEPEIEEPVVDAQASKAAASPVEQILAAATVVCPTSIAERNEDLLKGFKYICKVCGAKFKKATAFVQHEWEHSEDGTLSQCCPYCPRRFSDKKSYMAHTRCHVASHMNSSSGASSLESGNKLRRAKIQRNLICQYCHLIFPSPLPYIAHINQVHADVNDTFKYRCSVPKCKKPNYKHSWNFRVHLSSHSTTSDCNVCGTRFKSPANLHKHKKSAHKNIKWAEILSSSKLPAVPLQAASKRKHQLCTACMKKVDSTTDIHICSASTSFTCEICQMDFESKEELKAHTPFHRKLPCRICPRLVFVERMDLHLESHLGETPHECKICRRPYVTRDSLVKHLKCKEHAQRVREMRQAEDGEMYVELDLLDVEILEDQEEMEVSLQSPQSHSSRGSEGLAVDPLAELTNREEESTKKKRRNSLDSQQSSQSETSDQATNSLEYEQKNRDNRWLKSLLEKSRRENEDTEASNRFLENVTTRRRCLPPLISLNSVGSPSPQSNNSDDSGSSQGQSGVSMRILGSSTDEQGSRTCTKCDQVCRGIFGLGNHMLQAHNIFLCSSCNFCADSPEEHELHIQKRHGDSKLYCKACKKLFLNEAYMTRHTEGEMHKLRVLQIENEALADITSWDPDLGCALECHHRNFVCGICSLGQHTIPKLESHVLQAHQRFLCTICLNLCGSVNEMEAHRRSHVGESQHDCLICMIPYRKRAALIAHQRSRNHLLRVEEVNQSSTEETSLPIVVSAPFGPEGEPTLFIIPDQVEEEAGNVELSNQNSNFTEDCNEVPLDLATTITPSSVLVTEETSDIHRFLLNPETGDYQCCLCLIEFQEYGVFYAHMVAGHDVGVFKKVSSRVRKLFRNLNQKPQIFKCSRCRKIFLDNNCFKRHWTQFHGNISTAEAELNLQEIQISGQGIPSLPNTSKTPTPSSQGQINPAPRITPFPSNSNSIPITIVAPIRQMRTVYACVTCDNFFNNQVDLNIHAVKCHEKTGSKTSLDKSIQISNVESLTTSRSPQSFPSVMGSKFVPTSTTKSPEIIDLTEEDEESEPTSSPAIISTNSPLSTTNEVLDRESANPGCKLLLQTLHWNSHQPVINSVFSLQDAPEILEPQPAGELTKDPMRFELGPSAEVDQ